MNKDRMLKLADVIESGKYVLNMDRWHYINNVGDFFNAAGFTAALQAQHEPCGTAHCVAGTCQIEFASTPRDKRLDVTEFTRKFLGLTVEDADALFYMDGWDYAWFMKYLEADGDKEKQAKVCADYIRHLAEREAAA